MNKLVKFFLFLLFLTGFFFIKNEKVFAAAPTNSCLNCNYQCGTTYSCVESDIYCYDKNCGNCNLATQNCTPTCDGGICTNKTTESCNSCNFECGSATDLTSCTNVPDYKCWNKDRSSCIDSCPSGYTCVKDCNGGTCQQSSCISPLSCGTYPSCYRPDCSACVYGCYTPDCNGGETSCKPPPATATPTPTATSASAYCTQSGNTCGTCTYLSTSDCCMYLSAYSDWKCVTPECYKADSDGNYCYDAAGCGEFPCTSTWEKPWQCVTYDKTNCLLISTPKPLENLNCYYDSDCNGDPTPTPACIGLYLLPWGGQYCSGSYAGYYLCEDNCGGVDCKTYACGSVASPPPVPTSTPSSCDPLDYIPGVPTLTPPDGGSASVDGGGEVTTSWTTPTKTSYFEYEIYPSGQNCSNGYCDSLGSSSYSFTPSVSSYYHRVRSCNIECGTNCGGWDEATFTVSEISGQVKIDDAGAAVLVGGKCVLAGAPGVLPGIGSTVSVDNGTYIDIVGGSGLYSVSVPAGGSHPVELNIGDTSQYTCTCPANCAYTGIVSPTSDLDFFVSSASGPWWQVMDSDVITTGDISSSVPATKYFNAVGLGGYPGIPVYGGLFNLTSNTTLISTTEWNVNSSSSQSRLFNYSYFDNLVPDEVTFNDVSILPSGSGATIYDGYEWYKIESDFSIDSAINFGTRKVILFVDGVNSDLTINSTVNLTDGLGFFGVFVEGNIIISPTLTGSGGPALEGIYLSSGTLGTGSGNTQLHIRGSVAAFGGITLERDLGDAGNQVNPSELFEYAPDQVMLFPSKLSFRRTKWVEVAP